MSRTLHTIVLVISALAVAPAQAAPGVLARGPLPTVEQANAAFSRDPEYQASIGTIKTILACVPAAWEDAEAMPDERDWWCLAEAQPQGKETGLTEFGLYLDPKRHRLETLQGEYMGICPQASLVKDTLAAMVTLDGVTDLYDGSLSPGNFAVDMGFDQQLPKELLEGPPYLFYCDYIGRRGQANYLLKTFVTYDANGYHFSQHSFEQLFNDDGKLVDQNGKVLDDQS